MKKEKFETNEQRNQQQPLFFFYDFSDRNLLLTC